MLAVELSNLSRPWGKNVNPPCICTVMEHRLKIMPEFYQAVADGRKTFELRKDDRGFSVGDGLILSEWDGNDFTGREYRCVIDYLLKDYDGLCPGYAILGIVPVHKST